MSVLGSLFGRDSDFYRKRAESYIASGHWGEARLELARALKGLKDPGDPRKEEIEKMQKHVTCRLAQSHEEEGDHLLDSGLEDPARDRFHLALTLFADEEDRQRVEGKLSRDAAGPPSEMQRFFLDEYYPTGQGSSSGTPAPLEGDPLEYFEVLVNTLDPDRAEAYRSLGEAFALGYVYTNHGDYERAVGHYEEALQAHPGHSLVHKEFGRALLFHGASERAVEELTAAREGLSDDLGLTHLLASAYTEKGETDVVLQVLKEAQSKYPKEIETYLMVGDVYVKTGEMDKAKEAYEEALKIDPEFPEAHSRLGSWATTQGDETLAVEHFSEAVENGNSVQDMVALAELYLREDQDPEGALGLLNKALYYDPEKRWFYLVRIGEIYLKKGWDEKAREALSQAREMIPEDQREVLAKVNAFLGTES